MKTLDQLYDKLDSKEAVLDLMRLQKALLQHKDLYFSLKECKRIWLNFSDDLCAGWLCFPKKDDQILDAIQSSENFDSFENYAKKRR
jgi:hypothetical protein